MMENNIDKSSFIEGETSEDVKALRQKTAEILAGQQTNNNRFYCDALDDEEVNKVVRNVVPHVVTLIGFVDFGKSTFVGSLYHYLMVNGGIAGYTFYDSDTFSGFERRTYIRNVKLNPKTRSLRTTELDGYFLSLHFEKNKKLYELVLSDRSGETYGTTYITDEEKLRADKGLKNSKHLMFFIDASIFIDGSKSIKFNNRFNKLLTRMDDAGFFNGGLTIDVIFNKMDLIENAEDDSKKKFMDGADSLTKKIESKIQQKINMKFEISSIKVNGNQSLEDVFKYLVNCCDSKKTSNSKVDWVAELLKQ